VGAKRFWSRLLAAAGIAVVFGCTERAPIEPVAQPPSHDAISNFAVPSLVRCTPLPADSASAAIGPDGGVIQVGPHQLTVPAGALQDTVTITAVAPSQPVIRVRLEPSGLTFNGTVSLALSYGHCTGLALLVPKQVAYTDDDLNILELLPSLDDLFARRVTGQLSHFSDYAIAW
jgi:hypothetical protein